MFKQDGATDWDPFAQAGGNDILTEAEWNAIARKFRLSPREGQIVRGILADESESKIADFLGISPHTVHSHVGRIYRKLSVASRGQLFRQILATCRSLRSDEAD